MSLQQRRLLFYFFIFLFILVSPFAVLFATGRTINWQRLEIQKTASILIKSEPANANIFLNDKKPLLFLNRIFGKTTPPVTPAKLSNLAPGSYTIRLERNGYISWEEKIILKANEVANMGPIRLFKNSIPELTHSLDSILKIESSPDGRTVVTISEKKLVIYQVPEQKEFIQTLESPITSEIIWSNDQENFIINEDYIFNRSGNIVSRLTEKIIPKPSFIRFDDENNDLIYYIEKNQLHRYNFIDSTNEIASDLKTLLVGQDLLDYTISGRHLYLVFRAQNQSELVAFNLSSPNRQTTAVLPAGKYHFLPEKNKVLLLETTNRDLYWIEQPLPLFFSPRLTAVAKDYSVGRWQGDSLLYATPFEIRQWNNNNEKLVSRLSEPVIGIATLASDNELLYTTAQAINVRPLGDYNFNQSTQLLDIKKITTLLMIDNDSLYFIGEYNNQFGIFHLSF